MSYIAPSVTPVSGMPAFRIYTLNPKTFGVVDVETYYADMSNPEFQKSPTWTKYYSAREAYGPLVQPPLNQSAELTPAFWHNVTVSLESNQTSFDEYWARRTRGWDVQPCDEKCRKLDICQLRAARSENNCFVPSLGSGLSIRSVDVIKVDKTKCDNSMMSMTLRLIASRKDLLGKLAKQAGRI
ncbi:sphingomyelin phosphodiesterase [Fusarium albosuccineum]|uniref:Sphingomyelin phosphodiesterase n=1 Tax=Fusarium albosuccineum TaxID=1237068 RepID=A0A8H4PA32_9HYPO|nr:sphingomyelin phosphodiesterase [Fusarium albosuccineum]